MFGKEKPSIGDGVEKKESGKEISRREFLKKSAKLAALLGAGAVGGSLLKKAEVVIRSIEKAQAPRKEKRNTNELIATEIKTAREIIEKGGVENFLQNRFVISALYYSDNFLRRGLNPEKIRNDPTSQIIAGIKDLITPELRQKYLDVLSEKALKRLTPDELKKETAPLPKLDFGQGRGHLDALDIFIDEGSQVKAMTGGIVVLAENNWQIKDPLSTASLKGGNTVIVFNPQRREFYRYAHLESSSPEIGIVVKAGEEIGRVGHTGLNASLPGRGRHLHLEINYVSEKYQTRPRTDLEIRERLEGIERIAGL